MKKIILFLILITQITFTKAQNIVYDENAEARVAESFSSIDVSGTVFLYLSQGLIQGVAVSAGEAKYNEKIKTEVKDGVLHISVIGGVWNSFNWTNRKLKAYVTVIDLKQLEVSGASYVSTSGPLKGNELNIDVSGASELKGILNVNKLNMHISGASVAKVAGSVGEASIDASGAGKINGYDLNVQKCAVSSSGASGIKITVSGELNANASGGSKIYYKGPGTVKVTNASAGATIINRSGNND